MEMILRLFTLHLVSSLKSTGPSKRPEFNEPEPGHTWLYGKFPFEFLYHTLTVDQYTFQWLECHMFCPFRLPTICFCNCTCWHHYIDNSGCCQLHLVCTSISITTNHSVSLTLNMNTFLTFTLSLAGCQEKEIKQKSTIQRKATVS